MGSDCFLFSGVFDYWNPNIGRLRYSKSLYPRNQFLYVCNLICRTLIIIQFSITYTTLPFFPLVLYRMLVEFFCLYLYTYFIHLNNIVDPGPVTSDYLHDYEEQFGPSQLRYCTICQSVKPPRCHHCSICQVLFFNVCELDVCCEYGSSLSMVLQLHWVSKQEVFLPLFILCLGRID